jgi:intraflagellar transport protein 172
LCTSEKQQKSYLIIAIEFSPASQKIAVAQSDNIIYIYKIGAEWGDRKSICNTFSMPSAVTCLVWPRYIVSEIILVLAEGKVHTGVLKINKSNVLYQTDVYVVSIAYS